MKKTIAFLFALITLTASAERGMYPIDSGFAVDVAQKSTKAAQRAGLEVSSTAEISGGSVPLPAAALTGTIDDARLPDVLSATAWQAYSNGLGQSLSIPLLQVFNVKDIMYGATGNGTTDDTDAITNAVTALWEAGGGKLKFPPGVYRTSRSLRLPAQTVVEMDNAKIQQTDTTPQGTPIFHLLNVSNVTFNGVLLDGNWRNRGLAPNSAFEDVGVYLQFSTNVVFSVTGFDDFGKDGINFDFSEQVWVLDCWFNRCLSSGLSPDGQRLYIIQNDFANCGWSTAPGPHPGAVGDVDTRETIYAFNTFRTNSIGIFKDGGFNYNIIGNTFTGTNANCTNILIRGTSDGTVAANTMRGGTGARTFNQSLRIRYLDNLLNTHNGFIQDIQSADTFIEYINNRVRFFVASTTMRGFDIQGTKATGIGTVIKGNTIDSFGNAIRIATGVNSVLIDNNTGITGAADTVLIEGTSSGHVITDNKWLNQFNQSIVIGSGSNIVIRGDYMAHDLNIGAATNNTVHGVSLRSLLLAATTGTNIFSDVEIRGALHAQTIDRVPHQIWGFGIRSTNHSAPTLSGVATMPVQTIPLATTFNSAVTAASFTGNGIGLTNLVNVRTYSTNTAIVHTGTTSETTLWSFTLPGGALGQNGYIEITGITTFNDATDGKTFRFKIAGTEICPAFFNSTGGTSTGFERFFMCRNSHTAKLSMPSSLVSFTTLTGSGSAIMAPSIDTSVNTTFSVTCTLVNAADTATIEAMTVRVFYVP